MSLERLISMASIKGVDHRRVFEGSASTSPARLTRENALGAIAVLLSSRRDPAERICAVAAMLRDCPEHLEPWHYREIRQALNRELFVRVAALAKRPALGSLDKISKIVLDEHADRCVCNVCNGGGAVKMLRDDGTGVHDEQCPRCNGLGRVRWSEHRRAVAITGKSSTRMKPSISALYHGALTMLDGWRATGLRLAAWQLRE